jgi:hypothetical protein
MRLIKALVISMFTHSCKRSETDIPYLLPPQFIKSRFINVGHSQRHETQLVISCPPPLSMPVQVAVVSVCTGVKPFFKRAGDRHTEAGSRRPCEYLGMSPSYLRNGLHIHRAIQKCFALCADQSGAVFQVTAPKYACFSIRLCHFSIPFLPIKGQVVISDAFFALIVLIRESYGSTKFCTASSSNS